MLVSLYIHASFKNFFLLNFWYNQNFPCNTRTKIVKNKQKLSNSKSKQTINYVRKESMLSLNMTRFIWVYSVHRDKKKLCLFFIAFLVNKLKLWIWHLTQFKTSKICFLTWFFLVWVTFLTQTPISSIQYLKNKLNILLLIT